MRIVTFVVFLLLSVLHLFCAPVDETIMQKSSPRRAGILIINSYTESSMWSNDFIDPIYREFRPQLAHVDVFTEHMNMITIRNEAALADYKNELFKRYSDLTPQLIVLLGNSAWALLHEDISLHWANTPVILCAEKTFTGPRKAYLEKTAIPVKERVELEQYKGNLPLTVLYTPFQISGTLALMKQLMPDMKELLFLSDKRYVGAQDREEVAQLMRIQYPSIKVRYMIAGDVTNDALVDSLRTLHSGTGVLFLSWFQREVQAGNMVLTSNISRLLSNYSRVPIFTLHNSGNELNGLVGGCF